jgi:hypothetical protein
MKKFCFFLFAAAALAFVPAIFAQTSLNGQSLNGSTGLYSIPSGRIGWERSSDLGLDFGYRAVINDNGTAHIPSVTMSLFKWIEFSTAFDIQPDIDVLKRKYDENGVPRNYWETQKNDDLLFGIKVQLPTNIKNRKNPAVALGSNIQVINIADDDGKAISYGDYVYSAFQIYIAATYAGTFFALPSETTVTIGKTLYAGGPDNNSNIDFGMGFDLNLFPDVFKGFVHWIIDFANFDYSDNAWPNRLVYATGPAWYRGNMSTGFRIDMSAIPVLSEFKFAIDLIFNDLFDDYNRSFTAGAVFGFSILDAK